jgi:hypothetical protein
MAWLMIAGESGSPVHDYWPALERVQHVIAMSFLPSALLLPLGPAALSAAIKGQRWAAAYPILLLLNCAGTVALGLYERYRSPVPVVATSTPRASAPLQPNIIHDPCFSFAKPS